MWFAGYSLDDEGIRVWPLKKPKWRWADLQVVQCNVSVERNGPTYRMELSFSGDQKDFSVPSGPSKKLLAVLGDALERASEDVMVGEKVRFLMEWGPKIPLLSGLRKEFAKTQNPKVGVALATIYWANLNFRAARRTFQKVLEQDRRNLEALSGCAQMDIDREVSADKVRPKLERVLEFHPDDRTSLVSITCLLCAIGDDKCVEYARRCLDLYPDDIDVPTSLSQYYFDKEDYDQAAAVLEPLTDDARRQAVRVAALERIEFIQSYSTDPVFRAKTDRKARYTLIKGWTMIVLSFLPFILYVTFSILEWVDTRRHNEKMRELTESFDEMSLGYVGEENYRTNSQGKVITRLYKARGLRRELEIVSLLYQVPVRTLMEMNDLQDRELQLGQTLKVPVTGSESHMLFKKPDPVALPTTNDPPFATLAKLESVGGKFGPHRDKAARHLNAERDRLNERFGPLLLEFAAANRDRCFLYYCILSSDTHLDGRETMPELALQLLEEGIRTCIASKEMETDIEVRGDLLTMSVCAAGQCLELGRREEAIEHKCRAETLYAAERELGGFWPARSKEEIAAYDALPVPHASRKAPRPDKKAEQEE